MASRVHFDCFEVDLDSGQLYKRGVRVRLREKSFQVLASLLEHPGEVVAREQLRRRLWQGEVFVDFDNNLNAAIAHLREALNDSADHPRFIETLPKRGYRFLARITEFSGPPASASVPRTRLVVLPFLNLTGDPSEEYISDAMTDEVITALANLGPEHLAVIARSTAMHYKGSHKPVARIARELGAHYLVEGAVRRTDSRVGINVQLIQASDEAHLFARKYDVTLREMFYVPGCIAEAFAQRIPEVAGRAHAGLAGGAPARQKPVEDLVALDQYMRGRNLLAKGTLGALAAAKQHLEKALAHAPEFALAYDALAEVYWYMGYCGYMRPREAFTAGIMHAVRAIELDNSLAETHALLGQFHKISEYNWREVDREMSLALQLDPTSPTVRMRYAVSALMPHGRVDDAVTEIERALEIDPLSMLTRMWLGIMLLLSRRFECGIAEARKQLDLDPNSFLAHFILGVSCRYLGRVEEATAALRKGVELSGDAAFMLGWLGLTFGASGQATEARGVLRRLYDMSARKYVPPFSIACVHLGLRDIDAAFEWFDRAVDECDQFMMPIKSYAFLDPIRADPRFAALLRKMNLES